MYTDIEKELLAYLNKTPPLASVVYDMDLMPEQLEKGSRDYRRLFMLIDAWKFEESSWTDGK